MSFRPIDADLRRLLEEWLDNPGSRLIVLQRTWDNAVGERLSRRCQAVGFDDGVLTVEVTDSSWAPQLEAMSRELIKKVNEALGGTWVRRIAWQQRGPRDTSGAAPRS